MSRARPPLAFTVLLFGLVLVLGAPRARADKIDDLIALVQRKPDGMDRDQWRQKRRDAARTLGDSHDPRAVPVLIKVVQTEEFDTIGEIAIEGLGKLGDKRAVPVLRSVLDDPSRDRFTRDAARKALRKLGAPASVGREAPGPAAGAGSPGSAGPGGASGADEGFHTGRAFGDSPAPDDLAQGPGTSFEGAENGGEPAERPTGPKFSDDTLSATDRVTFALGGAHLEYDTVRKQPTFDGNLSATWERSRDHGSSAWRLAVQGSTVAGVVDYDGAGQSSRMVLVDGSGVGEARLYASGHPVYGLAAASAALSVTYLKVNRPGTADDTKDTRFGTDLGASVGGGVGRIIEMGEALRLRRIEQALRRSRALGRPISPDLAERIMSMWWALRGEQGAHQRLTDTVAMLREAGVLLGEPDASLTYQILQILVDGQLNNRPSGFDVNLGVSESYLVRDSELTDNTANVEDGRIESLFATAQVGHQSLDGSHELVGQGTARYRVLAGDGAPSPWAVNAGGAWRTYFYNRWSDPLGALELGAEAGISSDGLMDSDVGSHLSGSVGWLWSPNRASQFRLAGTARWETGELFLGAVFEASYGLLDTSYVGGAALAAQRH